MSVEESLLDVKMPLPPDLPMEASNLVGESCFTSSLGAVFAPLPSSNRGDATSRPSRSSLIPIRQKRPGLVDQSQPFKMDYAFAGADRPSLTSRSCARCKMLEVRVFELEMMIGGTDSNENNRG